MSTSAATNAPAPQLQRLGRYELLGEIASGGMATVFLGRAVGAKGFARLVAIKRLHPHLETEEDFVSMFLDEARLAARIRHPNCVPTLDVEDQEGLYLVMEYIEGDRLLGLLKWAARRGERIPPGIALRIAVEACAGLHAAHELIDDEGRPLNLVHRDVSPQNILVGIDGVTKITDFGIARAESRLSQTREGQLKGKIAYMAPEQTRRSSAHIDRRVDIFAMGIIVWEMLTGRRLFRGESDVEILNALVNEPIPTIRSFVPEIPDEVEAVVMKALEREPENRFQNCSEFGEAMEDVATHFGGLAPTRVVAQYVQQVSGPKLEQERARLRGGMTINGGEGADKENSATRKRSVTGELPAVNNAPVAPMPAPVPASSPRPISQPRATSNSTPNYQPQNQQLSATASLPAAPPMAAPVMIHQAPPSDSGGRLLFIGSLLSVACLASGAAFWFASRQAAPQQPQQQHIQQPAPPTPTPTPPPVAPPPVPAGGQPTPNTQPAVAVPGAQPTFVVPPGMQAMLGPNGQIVFVPVGSIPQQQPPSTSGGSRPRPRPDRTRPPAQQPAGTAAPAGTPAPTPPAPRPPPSEDDPIVNPYGDRRQ